MRRTFSSELLHCDSTEYHWRDYESSLRRRAEKLLKSQEYYVHARLPRCRLINNATESRPASGSTLLFSLSFPFLSPFRCILISRYRRRWRLRTAMAIAMAQSQCPLAKLKYLAFGRACKRLHDLRLHFANPQRVYSQSLINTGLGATCAWDTRNKFRTTAMKKKGS